MKKIKKQILLLFYLPFFTIAILLSSCTTLKPIEKNDALQSLTENDLKKFDGDYDIISVDSSFRTSEYALTFSSKFDFKNLPKANDRINLTTIDNRHIKVTVYKDDKPVKTRTIKGRLSQNYFQFRIARLSTIRPFYFILNGYASQRNRIGLLQNGDLTLDTDAGGVLLVIIMPTFGSGGELYNLVFKRRTVGNKY